MFQAAFVFVVLVATVLTFTNRKTSAGEASSDAHQTESEKQKSAQFKKFQRSFLAVSLLAWFSDWLQGAYIYDLYSSYGFSQEEIAQLFVAGFLSSMVFGSYVGAMADKYGRKKMCTAYALSYILSCCTKPFNDFNVLMVGRVLGGIATSLLFTVFEAWMVCEHQNKGFHPSLMSSTFSKLTAGNGVVAVLAGLVANASTVYFSTPLAPFIVACFPLTLVSLLSLTWSENYGDSTVSVCSSLKRAWVYICSDYRIVSIGFSQALFEAGMYIFVFIWTPALRDIDFVYTDLVQNNLGIIFASFMTCTIVGSNLMELCMGPKSSVSMYDFAMFAHLLATFALVYSSMTQDTYAMFALFLVFEVAVGMFYPSYSMIKSKHIQEEVRSTVMNYFRIPLNAFVAIILLRISHFPSSFALLMASGMHLLALLLFYKNMSLLKLTTEKEKEACEITQKRRLEDHIEMG